MASILPTTDAESIRGVQIETGAPLNGEAPIYNSATGVIEWTTPSGSGDMLAATYDPAGISEQVVGIDAVQAITNKTINGITNNIAARDVYFIVRKGSAGTIAKGLPVYISGYNSGLDVIEVEQADSDDASKMPAIGVAGTDLTNAADGFAINAGDLKGTVSENLDTSGFSVGDALYVSDTGTLTNVRPTAKDAYVQKVGQVLRSHLTLGVISVVGAGRTNDIPNVISDEVFMVGDDGDLTKAVQFELSGATTAKTLTLISSHTDDRSITFPDATCTLLYSGGALGTPSSGTLTNCTGLRESGLSLSDNTTGDFSTSAHGFVPKGTNVGNYLKDDGTWAAVSGGTSYDVADQRVWSDTYTVSRSSDTVVTFTAASSGAATIMANYLVGRLARWRDSGDTTTRYGFVRNATASGTTVTINLYGNAFAAGDTGFRTSLHDMVQEFRWYVPGEQVADSSNPVGAQYYVTASRDIRAIAVDLSVGTAAAGTGAACSADIYDDGTGLFTTDPDTGSGTTDLNNLPDNPTITGGSRLTLRTPTSAGATNKASDLNVVMYWAPDDLWDAV